MIWLEIYMAALLAIIGLSVLGRRLIIRNMSASVEAFGRERLRRGNRFGLWAFGIVMLLYLIVLSGLNSMAFQYRDTGYIYELYTTAIMTALAAPSAIFLFLVLPLCSLLANNTDKRGLIATGVLLFSIPFAFAATPFDVLSPGILLQEPVSNECEMSFGYKCSREFVRIIPKYQADYDVLPIDTYCLMLLIIVMTLAYFIGSRFLRAPLNEDLPDQTTAEK